MRLKARFTAALVLAAVLPLGVVAFLVGRDLLAGWRRQAVEAYQTETLLAAFAVEAYLQHAVNLVTTHAERPRLREGLATGSRELFDLAFQGLDPDRSGFETMFVVDARGVLRFHSTDPSLVGRDLSGRDYYQGGLQTGRPYVSTPYIGQATKQPTVAVVAPIRDPHREIRGLLGGTVTLQALGHIMDRLPRRDGTLMLVGAGGMILTHPEARRLMQPAEAADPAIGRVLRGEVGAVEWADAGGANYMSVFAPILSLGWGLVHTTALADVYAPIWAGGRRVAVFTLLTVAAAAAGGVLLARRLAHPILGLRQGVRQLARGDLGTRLNLRRSDELGELADDFDAMAAKLEWRMRELSLLQEIDRGILAAMPIPDLLERALHGFADLAGARSCFLVVPEGEQGTLQLLAAHTSFPEELRRYFVVARPRVGEGAAGQAIATGAPVISPDVAADPLWGRLRDAVLAHGAQAVIAIPLRVQEEVLGAVLLNFPTPRPFAAEEVEALQRLANQLAIALQQTRLREAAAERFRMEEAARAKALFIANMSHELRTPLNSIIGFTEILQLETVGSLNAKQHRYLGHVTQGGKHLLALINDVLDLSKAEAGQFTLRPEPLLVTETLEGALVIVKSQAAAKRIRLGLDLGEDLATVWADPIRFKQMLYNLLSNAVKFTPEGGQVTLRARSSETQLEIAVIDTGVGIHPEDMPRLFSEYSQVGPQRHEGTGLGLALTKRLAELHGGSIRVDSMPGQGSTFALTLPTHASATAAESREGKSIGSQSALPVSTA